MNKWKKRSKRILVFLLILGFIGGMVDHLQITVAAADMEEEISQVPNDTEKESAEPPVCVCELLCTEEAKEEDCPVCAEDLSACTGTALAEQSDEETDVEPEDSPQPPAGSASEPAEGSGKDLPSDSKISSENEPEKQPSADSNAVDGKGEGKDLPAASNASTASGQEEPGNDLADLPTDSEVAAVEELLKKLPSLDELKDFTQEEKAAAYEEIQKAFDAFESLKEEQKASLTGAEEQLKELLEYFTELVMPTATPEQIEDARQAMTAAMKNWEAEVNLSSFNLTQADMESIWPDVAQDNPDLFYVFDGTYFTDKTTQLVVKCQFSYNPQYSKNSVAEYEAAIDKVFDEVIDSPMSDEQKALALHDYLVQHMVYDQNANNNLVAEKRNAYEALVNGVGVCQGYTLAYAALLQKANIEVGYCKSRSMNHIWNYVKLDGKWYHADLTYDDITAGSQTGETGYVKHKYFLLSDNAMKQDHQWESNDITCSDTTYDSSWHKTSPIKESAIYSVGGDFYYLKGKTIENAPTIICGASLVKRASNGTETIVGSFDIENLGVSGGWPTYGMSFSRLSCSKGVLYFNVGNSVYSFRPSADAKPGKIYEYQDQDNRIVTGMLAKGDEMTLELFNPTTNKIEKIKTPVFSLSASVSKVPAGYTTAPVLTANPLATGFTWSKQLPNGSWEVITGATGSSYTMETGLPAGSYRYRAEATLNGKSMSAEIIIVVTAQEEQKNFAFAQKAMTVTYGDPDFTMTAKGAETGSSVSYRSSDPSVASVDPATGALQIRKAGTVVITATASETPNYLEATSTCTLTVTPKALTWDTSALEATDRLNLIQNGKATLYGELKLTGILEKDQAAVSFRCPADRLSGIYETVAQGRQKVKLSWKSPEDEATLQGNGRENYTMPAALPEISGRISVVNDSYQESVNGTAFKLQIENTISQVPDSFKDKEHLNTPGKIIREMKLKLQQKFSNIADANIVVYDVELLINVNGVGWQKATKDNFPSEGLTITLPYPAGTGRTTHDYVVSHMFTADMNGFHAGDVEYPTVTKTEKGLTFKVNGLSPVSIGWREAAGNESGNSGSTGSPSSANRVTSPSTGDTSSISLYLLLAIAACSLILRLSTAIKKRR